MEGFGQNHRQKKWDFLRTDSNLIQERLFYPRTTTQILQIQHQTPILLSI